MRLDLKAIPPSLNKTQRMNRWALTDLKEFWRALVRTQIIPTPMNVSQKKRVKVTLHHSRLYDRDNSYGAVKVLVDALRAWNLIWDDSAKFLDLTVEQEKCPHKQRHTVVEIEAA